MATNNKTHRVPLFRPMMISFFLEINSVKNTANRILGSLKTVSAETTYSWPRDIITTKFLNYSELLTILNEIEREEQKTLSRSFRGATFSW